MIERPSSERRRRAHGLGLRAEWAAVALMILEGYRILELRYSAPGGEIDLIVRRRDTIAFVEVKARATFDQAMTSITLTKERRISVAAIHWLSRNQWASGFNLRGDAIFVGGLRWPKHQPAAFRLRLG